MPPPPAIAEAEIEETLEGFKIDTVEETIETQESEESESEKELEDEYPVYPHDITWEYLKGLEKISLLTPEKEVALAKRIKEGERQVKLLETRTHRVKSQLALASVHTITRRGSNGNGHKYKLKGKNGKNGKKPKKLEPK
jgi:DNA-directed RNA polymerase sigma subunit (sigma70/sigma32)